MNKQGETMERLGVVIVAAGKGSRMQTSISKQFIPLLGKPILAHTIQVFEQMEQISEVVVVTGAADLERVYAYCEHYKWKKIKSVVPGGTDRQASVYRGLQEISEQVEWVFIHDGVRPLITPQAIMRCLEGARKTGAAVLAVPVKDTIKQVNKAGEITATPNRSSLRAIQTPQVFRRTLIIEAHREAIKNDKKGTDDASLAEYMGHTVVVVEGDYCNLKITTPEDLIVAEHLLKNR